jgi:hypothetical protein
MQRRTGRGQAHISPPQQMSPDPEKASSRPIGVKNRLWILLLLIFIIAGTLFIWPIRGSRTVVQIYSNADVKAKNYFNATEAGPNPFLFCPNYGPGDELGAKYGAVMLSKSRFHLGSGDRVQRVLNRALAGQPVTISILGGSSKWLIPYFHTSFHQNIVLQYQLVMEPETTQYLLNVTLPNSSNGGTLYSPTQPQSSQTAPCDVPAPPTLATVTLITFRMSQTW